MVRVLIADSHRILRRGIREILEEAGDIFVIGEAGDHRQLLAAVREYQFDVLLFVFSTPKERDLDTLEVIYRQAPDIKLKC